jgi:formylglycine-generating enzyme required for sulfatase activity
MGSSLPHIGVGIMAYKVFINYRRSLNLTEAQLLQKVLQRHFGKSGVFLDVSGLEGGEHWLHALERQVDASDAMVCLIPKGWADMKDEKGARRLDNPNDFVRFEIARAFARRMPVLPLRLDGAEIPDTDKLPPNLQQLSFQQAMLLRRESFDDDADKAARRLKVLIAEVQRRGVPRIAVAAIAIAALGAGVAAGPAVLTQIGLLQPMTDTAFREALAKAQKRAEEAEAALAEARSARDKAAREAAQAEQRTRAAEADRDRAQAALAEARTKLAAAEDRARKAEAERDAARAAEAAALERAKKAEGGRQEAEVMPEASFKDCPDCPKMVTIPAGKFIMGSNDYHDEKPPHEVILKPFAVGKYTVTFDEWDRCVKEGGCKTNPSDEGWGRGNRPVIYVSWNDAKEYVAWLSKKTGKDYRLLSEAEWEYAARAGTTTKYYWGDDIGKGNANCDGCGSQWDNKQTAPVGSFKANAFGLYDMAGNVWQWVEDCYHEDYYGAPKDGSAATAGACTFRVLRGGSWNRYRWELRAAARNWGNPFNRYGFGGFRLARTITP